MTDPLLAEIDKMIEAVDNGVHAGYHSFEVSDKLEEIKKLIIADRERMIKAFTDSRGHDHDGFLFFQSDYERAIAIVKGEEKE